MIEQITPTKHDTAIRWTHGTGKRGRTWNPVRGCSIVSPGCTNCYAMKIAERFSRPGLPFEGFAHKVNGYAVWTGKVVTLPAKLHEPLSWREPSMVFCNSMADLFHPDVPFTFLDQVFDVMESTPRHTFQILTKRPERMREYVYNRTLSFNLGYDADKWVTTYPNIWLGVSVEDQRRADERIPLLLDTPAAVRFLSMEPLLAPTTLFPYVTGNYLAMNYGSREQRLHWVIVGGESGPGYRPMDLQWARDLRDQCAEAGIPFFFKQSSGPRTEMGQELDGQRCEQWPA